VHRGATCVTVLFFYYFAPLSTLRQVLVLRDSASFYWPLCVMNSINGTLWMVYGLVRRALRLLMTRYLVSSIASLQQLASFHHVHQQFVCCLWTRLCAFYAGRTLICGAACQSPVRELMHC
jgi:hypothetical protein